MISENISWYYYSNNYKYLTRKQGHECGVRVHSAVIWESDKYSNTGYGCGGHIENKQQIHIYFMLKMIKSTNKLKNCKKNESNASFISLKHKNTSQIF